ncbi:LacI family transcriptional regulator [Salipaludibacillus neizhouensis]|uniref:LacI family transcriptional regulator n=1 Tax=Salipaludibacillus neizhouensis TaxID=885475 RepID=A0A3A9K820_9BACI|nr:LacI family DNA-binding transcriptional regulator [Salipaludibacillus neizhouensis]RKL68359.1 LacI family transcriptional regulator [Salipaludibacillus neizhouensis]
MKIDDIAKLANVSKSAVSLALNGKPGVSEETRNNILKIAEQNGYAPRTLIKTGAHQKNNSKILRFVACTNIGIVTEQYQSLSFFMELINTIDQTISEKDYSLIISSINSKNLEEEISQLEQEQKSAGILLLGTNLTANQINIVAKQQPKLVVLDTCFETLDVNFVVMNNFLGAFRAGEHLAKLGHKKIGYVQSNSRMYNFDERKRGFMKATSDHNLEVDKNHLYSISPTLVSSQDVFKQKILENGDNLPTALFCECDYMAISVIKALAELGIKSPETISVMGFDNIFEAQIVSPELTTIHVKKDSIATMAVDKLIKQIEENDNAKMKIFVDTELVERKSCRENNSLEVSSLVGE